MKKGFTLLETLIALSIVVIVMGSIIPIYNRYRNNIKADELAMQSIVFAKAVKRFVELNYTQLQTNINAGETFAYSVDDLKAQQILPQNYSNLNRVGEQTCILITKGENNNLQTIVVMKKTQNSNPLSQKSLFHAMSQIGEFAWGISGGKLYTQGNDYQNMSYATILDIVSNIVNAGVCSSNLNIDDNSIVLNISVLDTNFAPNLESNTTLSAYQGITQDNNQMNTDLSLAPNNNLIFQINPNVKPKLTGSGVTVASHYNDPLTESQQLALSANGNNVNVTGFNQAQYVKNGYVGGLSALNVQPTAVVATATPCNPEDIGSKALQMPKGGLERLAYSQMVCQKNPLCATTSPTETCYMPINTYSIEAHPNKFTFDAPDGFYIRYVHYKDQYADTRYFSDGQATSFRDPWGIMRCGSSECLKATSGQYNCHDSAGGWGMGEAWGTWQPRGSPLSAAQTFTFSTDPSPFYTGLAVDEFLSNGTTMNNSTNGIGVINVDGLLVPKRAYGQYRYWWRQHDGDGGKCTYWWGGGFSRQDLVIDDVIYTNDVSQLQAIVN